MAKGDYIAAAKSGRKKIAPVSVADPYEGRIRIKGKKTGRCKVQITLGSGLSKTITVRVQKKKVKTRKIIMEDGADLTMQKGEKKQLSVRLRPFTSLEKVQYASENEKIASISRTGVVTAKKSGIARIIVRAGTKRQEILINVR